MIKVKVFSNVEITLRQKGEEWLMERNEAGEKILLATFSKEPSVRAVQDAIEKIYPGNSSDLYLFIG